MTERDHPLRGLRVVAYIDDLSMTILTGILVSVGLDGEVAIRGDDGQVTYGWPCLELRLAAGAPRWEPDPEADWPDGPSWPDDPPARPTTDIYLPGDGP
jgi:hypothetical protein